jgi:hypothetical protein
MSMAVWNYDYLQDSIERVSLDAIDLNDQELIPFNRLR